MRDLLMMFAAWLAFGAQPAPAAPAAVTEEAALRVAARMVEAGPALARIWPGFWPEEQPFVINLPDKGAFLVAPGPRPPGWEAVAPARLPRALQGRTYFRAGPIAGASRPFITNFPIGDGRTAIFVNADDDDTETIALLLLHEQFHVFQSSAFKGGLRQFVAPDAVADRVAFAASAELERRVLAAALAAGPAEQRRLLRTYFAVRREREGVLAAEVREVERNFERSEGTARYVDRMGQAALFGGTVDVLLADKLRESLLAKSGPFTTIWFRDRSYATGAALTYLLSRIQPDGWRARIEAGGDPASLVEGLIAPHPQPREAVRQARARFGYAALVRQLRPAIEAGAKAEIKNEAEFLALGAYPVTIELGELPSMPSTFSAVDMTSLDASTLVLRRAISFTMSGGATEIVVRGRPVLSDSAGDRLVVVLDGPPPIAGAGEGGGGVRLERLRIEHEGLTLRHDGPATVTVAAGRMTIRLLPPAG